MFSQRETLAFIKTVSSLPATAANYYLRAAFFSDLGGIYFLTFASREVSVSETGRTCLHAAANTNTAPSEGACYVTAVFQLAEQIGTHAWEPSPNRTAQHTLHTNTLYSERIKSNCRASTYTLHQNSMTGDDFREIVVNSDILERNRVEEPS